MRTFGSLRKSLHMQRWRMRLTLWLAAASAAGIVVVFEKSTTMALELFFHIYTCQWWLPFVLTPSLGMLCVWLTNRYFPGSQGSGIPQVIAATRLVAQGKAVSKLVSLRIALGKVAVGSLALVGGFSAGREGPSVQVSASIVHFFHRFLPVSKAIRESDLILAGGAAGIAAAFNTPLAGIVFAVEEMGRRLETRTSGVLLSTIIVAGLVSMSLLGNYNYFGHLHVGPFSYGVLWQISACGLACGLAGGAFSRFMLLPMQHKQHALWQWRSLHPVWFAGLCGLLVAAIGWASGGLSFGSGYSVTSRAVAGEIELPWTVAVARFTATLLTYFSGIPGGVFAPSLAVGAAIGSSMASAFADPQAISLIIAFCMAGFLAAATQSPITSAIIVMEMVDSHEIVISLMAVALIAKVVSASMGPELYQQLALGFERAHAPPKPHAQ